MSLTTTRQEVSTAPAPTNTTPNKLVTINALVARLRRRHARDGERFRVNSNERYTSDLGYWYVTSGNYVQQRWDRREHLIEHAREIGALASNERVNLGEEVSS